MAKSNFSSDLTQAIEKLKPHDHLCLIYENQEEQLNVAIPFIKMGLERHEKCIYIVDENTFAMIKKKMRAQGIKIDDAIRSHQLSIINKQDSYLKLGKFDPDWMIKFLKETTKAALAEGYSALRVTGEMTWALGSDPGNENLFEYESKLNRFFPKNASLAICQYNRNRFSPEIILNVIRTHPFVIFRGIIYTNYFFIHHDIFNTKNQPEQEVNQLLEGLQTLKRKETNLVLSEQRTIKKEEALEKEQSERKKAQEFLEASQKRFQGLFENMGSGVAVYEAIENGRKVTEVFPGIREMKLLETFQRVWKTGKAEHLQIAIYKDKGMASWRDNFVYRLISGEIVAIYEDVTEKKNAEEKLAWLASFPAASPILILEIDQKGKIIFANPSVKKRFPDIELVGKKHPFLHKFPYVVKQLGTENRNITTVEVKIGEHWFSQTISIVPGNSNVRIYADDITERKKVEQLLIDNEEKFRILFDEAPDGYYISDLKGNFIDGNLAGEKITGYRREELVGSSFLKLDLLSKDQIIKAAGLLVQNMRGRSTGPDEFILKSKEGIKIPVEIITHPVNIKGRKLVLGIARDISKRKKDEEQIKYQASLLENVNDAITATDLNHKITAWNHAAELLFGWNAEEAIGQITTDLFKTEYPNTNRKEVLAIRDRTGRWRGETSRVSKDGVRISLEESSIALKDENGKISGYVGAGRDITERKRIEKTLQDSQAEQQALFDSMQDIVIVYNKEGRYLNIANTASKLFINSPKDLIGKTIHEVFPKKEADKWVGHIQAVLATQSTKDIEYSLEIDHHMVWLLASVSPMDKERVIWVAHDITNRKKNELIQKTIYGITQAAIADKGIDDLYHSIHSFIGELIPAENFYIALLDPATNLISFPYYVDQYDQAPIEPTPIQGFTGYVIRTGQPLLANQEVTDRLIQKGEVEVVGTLGEDWMGTPLKLGERMLGVMAVQSYSKTIHFNEDDLKFFEFVSTQVAQAIDRKQRENESFFIGTHDQLTGLYNRTFFEEELSRLEKSRHFPVSIFMFDVDDLKTINDTQGHPAGDELLKRAANVLLESFRPEDMVARIGGDEYVAILPRTTKETAKLALDRINHFLELNNKNNQNKLTISIGFATCEQQGSLADTLKQADDCMYLDKRSKR